MSDNGQNDNPLIAYPSRRYLESFFWQWQHHDDGRVSMHVYPGFVDPQRGPIPSGEPIVLIFTPEGWDALLADVGRGGKANPVQVVKAMPDMKPPRTRRSR